MARPLTLLACAFLAALASRPAEAADFGAYLVPAGGDVRSVRTADVDGDGRIDLVALVRTPDDGYELVVFRTPATPTPRVLFPADHIVRIPCDGARARAGAVALGRFGPGGEARLRFLGPEVVEDVKLDGTRGESTPRHAVPSLLARSAGRPLVWWDAVADLDADGRDEVWFPLAAGNGAVRVFSSSPPCDRVLSLEASNQGSSDGVHRLARHAYVPNLFPADLDGDGTQELVALRDNHLLAWSLTGAAPQAGPLAPSYRLHLPFLDPDPTLGPEALRTPRIQITDVDGDGIADLLVTLISGLRTNLMSIRTILFHYPGPFRDPETQALVKPKTRIDTQSIVLHPTFIDLDGDGAKDYVGDSIRGTMVDLIARLMGQDPKITFVGFRFDKRLGTFRETPWFTTERLYASKQALDNSFGRSAWLEGDFDGDGTHDLLDLGALGSVQILGGAGDADALTFERPLLPALPVEGGLQPDAAVADLNGDGRADAALWGGATLYVVLSKGKAR